MAGLASEVNTEQSAEFFRRFGRFGGNIVRLKRLLGDDALMEQWVRGLDQFPVFHLRHGLWTPLPEVIETVKAWPTLLDRFGEKGFQLALEEFNDSPRHKRLESEQEKNRLVQAVVVPYLASVQETFLYARARMMDAFGTDYDEWKEAYAQDVDDKRIQLLPEATDRKECLHIEVVDFGVHFNLKDGFVPQDIRGKNSAHAAVIYATSQNTPWVRQMDGIKIPFALAGGYKLNVPGGREWMDLPSVWRNGDRAELRGDWCDDRYFIGALPVLWE